MGRGNRAHEAAPTRGVVYGLPCGAAFKRSRASSVLAATTGGSALIVALMPSSTKE